MSSVQTLLSDIKTIQAHQQEIKRLKGENFNIFSILQVEHKENGTHSAFIGDLLNPSGSHFLKDQLLAHFLRVVDYHGELDIKKANVRLEKHIGRIDTQNNTGGRIDIYIYDALGNTISIENKIYAGDQENQIKRYINHNKSKNTVYYLTLWGKEAEETSVSKMEEGDNYYQISYQQTIVKWLSLCIKEAADQPMLRETIKQYSLLIKKLTNQLTDNKMDEQVITLIKENYQAAKLIIDNLWKVEKEICEIFLNDVKTGIHHEFGSEVTVDIHDDLTQRWSGLDLYFPEWDGMTIKLEGQPKIPWNDVIYGITSNKDIWDRDEINAALAHIDILKSDFRSSHHWPYYQYILWFSNREQVGRLFTQSERWLMAEQIAEKMITLAKLCRVPLSKVKRKQ